MPFYADLFMRDTFEDSGNTPVQDAYISASPDIIPYGTGTLTGEQLVSQYGRPLIDVPMVANNINNIYVRATNNFDGAETGQIYLYYTTGNLLEQVSRWKNNLVPNNNGSMYANVSAAAKGAVAPGDQPFGFSAPPSVGAHFCFLARVSTTANPNPLPQDFTRWGNFVGWVRNSANVAWHNVDVVTSLPAQGYQNALVFENVDAGSQFYGFTVTYTNLPANSQLRLYSLANSSVGYTGFDTGTQKVSGGGSIGGGSIFPGGYSTTIFTTCVFPGSPVTPPPGVGIQTQSLGNARAATEREREEWRSFTFHADELALSRKAIAGAGGSSFVQITSFTALIGTQSDTTLLTRRR